MSNQQSDQPDAPHDGPEPEAAAAGSGEADEDASSDAPAPETSAPTATTEDEEDATDAPGTGDTTPADPAVITDPPVLDSTGDDVVDAALEQFDRVTGEPLATHIEAAEKVQDTLQSRLADLGDG